MFRTLILTGHVMMFTKYNHVTLQLFRPECLSQSSQTNYITEGVSHTHT